MASRFWVLSNEDSRAARFRQLHVQQNGGSWSFESNLGWQWKSDEEVQTPKPAKPEPPPERPLWRPTPRRSATRIWQLSQEKRLQRIRQ